MPKQVLNSKLITIAIVFLVICNYPFLAFLKSVNLQSTTYNTYLYLFSIWLLFIIIVFIISNKKAKKRKE
jgi:hypothetical protein